MSRTDLGWLRPALRVMTAAAVSALCACGGGVDTGGTGVAPASFAQGPISGFGSIVVGGVHFDERGAALVDDDGQPIDASALALGVTTRIDAGAVVDTGTALRASATRVQVVEALVGPVAARDAAALTLTLLGQTVQVTPGTFFDSTYAGGLAAVPLNAVVVVYGQLDPAGQRIVATRIAPRPAAPLYVVRAAVTQIDRAAMRLSLGALQVDVGMVGLPAALAIGDVVRVKLSTTATAGVWTATELGDATLRLPTRDDVELEGRITVFNSAASFSVDGVAVDASAATFPAGSAGLGLGSRVEVEGRSTGGVLIADTVKLKSDDSNGSEDIELEGRISNPDAAARTFLLRGVTVSWNDSTIFEGGQASDLVPDRQLAVRGQLGPDGSTVVATRIHVEL